MDEPMDTSLNSEPPVQVQEPVKTRLADDREQQLPLFVEIFAGRASFSRAVAQAGFEVVSVDHEVDSPFRPIVSLDLTTESGQKILWQILASDRLVAAHLGLPRGTASKARDRPIPQEFRRRGVPSPAPLRSAEYPFGLPRISGVNAVKVEKANILYRLGLEFLLYLDLRGVVVSVQIPLAAICGPH